MTAETISKIFNVFPQSIVLVGDDGTVATPAEDGGFCVYEMSTDVEWSVNGDKSKPSENQNIASMPSQYILCLSATNPRQC